MEENTIPISPEIDAPAKKKPRRSAKPKSEQPQNPEFSTLDTPRTQEVPQSPLLPPEPARQPAELVNGASKPYEWDRTIEENRLKEVSRLETERLARLPLPQPKAKTLPWLDFCEYWNSLRELPIAPVVRLYVRRWLPVLLPVIQTDRFGMEKEAHPSDLTIKQNDGVLSEDLILQLGGVGDYTFRLNDSRRPWEQATICQSQLETKRLWDNYPPVFDHKRLDYEDKKNQVFIKFARARGILPREDEAEREQSDMAQVQVIDTVISDARKERDRADQLQSAQLAKAERETAEAKAALERERADREKAQSTPATPAKTGAAAELESVGNVLANLATILKPAPDNSFAEYLKVQQEREKGELAREKEERDIARRAAEAERKRADDLQAELLRDMKEAIKTAAQPTTPAIAPAAPKTDVDLLEEMVKKQSLMKQLTGRGGGQEEAEKPSAVDKLAEWAPAIQVLGPIVQGIVGGIFQTIQFGLQSWQQVSYNNALSKNGSTPQPPTVMNQQQPQAPPAAGQPAPAQGPPPTPEQIAQHQRLVTMLKSLEDAATPILIAFSKGESGDSTAAGATFADTIISFKGRPDYDMIRALGQTQTGAFDLEMFTGNVKALLGHQGRGPNTAHLAKQVESKPSFGQFLAGFFNYDLIMEEERKRREDEDNQ